MSQTVGVRQAQKQRTRQALLDAALTLLADQSLSSLGIREVTRAVGVAPTAFYRHFRSTADLGVALVEEVLDSLHPMVRSSLEATGDPFELIDTTVELIAAHAEAFPAHIRFLARERHGGVEQVRTVMAEQQLLFAEEARRALVSHPESEGWSEEDVLMLAQLYVDHMMNTAIQLVDVGPEEREARKELSRRQMRLIHLGRVHWLDD